MPQGSGLSPTSQDSNIPTITGGQNAQMFPMDERTLMSVILTSGLSYGFLKRMQIYSS